MAYCKDGCMRPVIIPKYRKGIQDEKIPRSLMKTAGIDRDTYLDLKDRFE